MGGRVRRFFMIDKVSMKCYFKCNMYPDMGVFS